MDKWESDPAFADLRQLAQRLEAAFAAANDVLLKAAGLNADTVTDAFADVQADLLRFDDHARRRFREALEEKRVKTLSQGNVFMTCVLASAVALSEFKSQPRPAVATALARRLDALRASSTNGVSLGIFAWASFNALLGTGAWRQLRSWKERRAITAGKAGS